MLKFLFLLIVLPFTAICSLFISPKKEKNVTVLSGSKITVRFDKPRALQIDGETITNVTEYTVKAQCWSRKKNSKNGLDKEFYGKEYKD